MDTETLLSIPAELVKCESKRLSQLKLTFESREGLTPEQIAKFSVKAGREGTLLFLDEVPSPEDLVSLPPLPLRERKSPGQRIRGILYLVWEKRGNPHGSFSVFYEDWMGKLADKLKEELD